MFKKGEVTKSNAVMDILNIVCGTIIVLQLTVISECGPLFAHDDLYLLTAKPIHLYMRKKVWLRSVLDMYGKLYTLHFNNNLAKIA